jgi:hypothetical protein
VQGPLEKIVIQNFPINRRFLTGPRPVFTEPVDGSFEAFVESHLGLEAEEFFGTRDVEPAPGLTVGLGRIPSYLAFETGELDDFFDKVFNSYFETCADIDGFGAVIAFGGKKDTFRGVASVNELARCGARSPADDMVIARVDCIDAFLYKSRNDMGTIGMEIIPRAVEIDGDKEYAVETVFGTIGLGLYEKHFLGEAIRSVCFLGVAIPDIVFLEGDRGKFGIRADGADSDEFFEVAKACLVDELDAHHKVFIEEFAGVLTIGANTPYYGGEVDYDIRLHIVIHPDTIVEIDEVIVLDFGDEDIFAAAFLQTFNDITAKKAGAAGNHNSFVFE